MNERSAPAACAAITMPSISMCGVFCISSRSLNVPGSDSSALHTRYLSIVPFGRNETFLPLAHPAPPPLAARPGFGEVARVRVGIGDGPPRELLVGQHRAPGEHVLEQLRHV